MRCRRRCSICCRISAWLLLRLGSRIPVQGLCQPHDNFQVAARVLWILCSLLHVQCNQWRHTGGCSLRADRRLCSIIISNELPVTLGRCRCFPLGLVPHSLGLTGSVLEWTLVCLWLGLLRRQGWLQGQRLQ